MDNDIGTVILIGGTLLLLAGSTAGMVAFGFPLWVIALGAGGILLAVLSRFFR